MRYLGIFLIRGYQYLVRPFWSSGFFAVIRSGCRFPQSCSDYALDMFQQYPFLRAVTLSISRVLRCHPFS